MPCIAVPPSARPPRGSSRPACARRPRRRRADAVHADPVVTRLTPPSNLFDTGSPLPVVARFLPGQRFDLQATVKPDPGRQIVDVRFFVNGTAVAPLPGGVPGIRRAYSHATPGTHLLTVIARQDDGKIAAAQGNFQIEMITPAGKRAKNVIFLIGDGMGIAHRTAARIMLHGVSKGKANAPLAMDTFPVTGMVITHSLNSIVTDSAPGAHCYSTGNKGDNNQEGVFPDDTADKFDNPRIENIGEYLRRTQNKALGIVTTADVFDATPASFAVHTQDRGAGTGICDQYLDESDRTGPARAARGRPQVVPARHDPRLRPGRVQRLRAARRDGVCVGGPGGRARSRPQPPRRLRRRRLDLRR
jgi:alkaline phosphatase